MGAFFYFSPSHSGQHTACSLTPAHTGEDASELPNGVSGEVIADSVTTVALATEGSISTSDYHRFLAESSTGKRSSPQQVESTDDADHRGSDDDASGSSLFSSSRRDSNATTATTASLDPAEPACSGADDTTTKVTASLKPLSILEPTAKPFVFTPTNEHGAHPNIRDWEPAPFRRSSSLSSPSSIAPFASWSVDAQGTLVGVDNLRDTRYQIADEILQLQSPDDGGRFGTSSGSAIASSRRGSLASPFSHEWSTSIPQRPRIPQLPFARATLPPTPPSYSPEQYRSRSSSFDSLNGGYLLNDSVAKQQTLSAAHLQAYFEPAVVTDQALANYKLGWQPSPPSSVVDFSPSVDSDDVLYDQARQVFVRQSLASLAPSAGHHPAHKMAMQTHFDAAMASSHPLATLYGMSNDDADALLRDPAKSGVSEVVLTLVNLKMAQAQRYQVGGPAANNRKLALYKTELCRSWEEKGNCRYGTKCQFAHGVQELRDVPRHPKFKSEVCRTFWLHGHCPYGRRCCFIHTTLDGATQPTQSAACDPLSSLTHPLSAVSLESKPDSTSSASSRIGQRMSASSAKVQRSNGTFGPALADYLGETPTSSANPKMSALRQFDDSNSKSSSSGLFGVSLGEYPGIGLGIGLKAPGKFTNNPLEVPPTFQEPPQSRLQRLVNLNGPATRKQLSSHVVEDRRSSSSGSSDSSAYRTPSAISAATPTLPVSMPVSAFSAASTPASLKPVASDWLGAGTASALEWSSSTIEDDCTPSPATSDRLRRPFDGVLH